MRAGRLTEAIRIERSTHVLDDFGGPTMTWARVAVVRAERVDQTTTEFIRNFGAVDEELVIFRARFFEGVRTSDRGVWRDEAFNIKQIAPIGRREGLELRCVRLP